MLNPLKLYQEDRYRPTSSNTTEATKPARWHGAYIEIVPTYVSVSMGDGSQKPIAHIYEGIPERPVYQEIVSSHNEPSYIGNICWFHI